MSAVACTRPRSLMGPRTRPPLRLPGGASAARPMWRGIDAAAVHDRARVLPLCGAAQAVTGAG